LWGVEDTAFIPHGFEGEPRPAEQPIFVSPGGVVPNSAGFRFYIDGTAPDEMTDIERASILFDGRDETAVELARDLWRRFKAEAVPIRYWKQDEDGRWRDQAA
jgi:DNA polymerase III subunit chi